MNYQKSTVKFILKSTLNAKGTDEVNEFLSSISNIEYLENNFYHILGQDNIKSVYSISSSTVLESKYFGKDSEFLYKSPFLFFLLVIYLIVDIIFLFTIVLLNLIFGQSYWEKNEITKLNRIMPEKANRLRNSIQNYWGGYNFLDSEILDRHTRG